MEIGDILYIIYMICETTHCYVKCAELSASHFKNALANR